MISLIYGGSGSGKSEYAERLAMKAGGDLKYIAAMIPIGEDAREKIERHRKLRSGKGFETIECYKDIGKLEFRKNDTVLLECLSNLTANEFFEEGADRDKIAEKIAEDIRRISEKCAVLIVVSNNVFEDGIEYDKDTTDYMRCLAQINMKTAEIADDVTEVVCGIGVKICR
ncbi:MAG: bifunctional adenosylcobinamide kinase/adenosylcobinamide-phosphate guanylyltransferase [Firmicutes bacterium]|nr:bifunctional adenosylcobinamide kinase/adenosylcobinamide-phosphate guanylyltransferase [Bacillota bacterium]